MLKHQEGKKESPATMAQMAQTVSESMGPVAPVLGSAKRANLCRAEPVHEEAELALTLAVILTEVFLCVCSKNANEFLLI